MKHYIAKEGNCTARVLNSLQVGTTLSEFGCRFLLWIWGCSQQVYRYHCEGHLHCSPSANCGWCAQGLWIGKEESKLEWENGSKYLKLLSGSSGVEKSWSLPQCCNATDSRGHPCCVYFAAMMTCIQLPSLNSQINWFRSMAKITAPVVLQLLFCMVGTKFLCVYFEYWVLIPLNSLPSALFLLHLIYCPCAAAAVYLHFPQTQQTLPVTPMPFLLLSWKLSQLFHS